MTSILKAENLRFAYSGGADLFKEINISLHSGEILGITGPSGCGKTTLIYCLSGIIPHIYPGLFAGTVEIEGEDTRNLTLPRIAQKLGIVFQDPNTQLFSHALEDDVVFGPENLCLPWAEMDRRLQKSLKITGMLNYRYRKPQTLSGGEAQLSALSAVLALEPAILIFDEAASRLDEKSAEMLLDRILKLKNEGRGIIFVDHDQERLKIADRTFLLEEGILYENG